MNQEQKEYEGSKPPKNVSRESRINKLTFGPQQFRIRRIRQHPALKKEDTPHQYERLVRTNPKKNEFPKSFHRVPLPMEDIPVSRLVTKVKGSFERYSDKNEFFQALREKINTLDARLNEVAYTSQVHRHLLTLLRDVGTRINRTLEDAESALDIIHNPPDTYREARLLTSTNVSQLNTLFKELGTEVDLIEEVADTIDGLQRDNEWFALNAPHRNPTIPTLNLIPQFNTTQTLYQSFISILITCKAYCLQVLKEIIKVSGRLQNSPSSETLLNKPMFRQVLESETHLDELLQQATNMDKMATSPAIREDKGKIIKQLIILMSITRHASSVLRFVANVNKIYEDSFEEQPAPLEPLQKQRDDLRDRWNSFVDWREEALRVRHELTSHQTTEDTLFRRAFGKRGKPSSQLESPVQLFPSKDSLMSIRRGSSSRRRHRADGEDTGNEPSPPKRQTSDDQFS